MLFQRALISFRLLGGKRFLEIYVRLIATTIQIPTYPDATGLPPLPTHSVHILVAYFPGKSPQSCLTLCNLMDCRLQAPLSMGFSRQEYWSGLWFPFPGDLPNLAITPGSHVSCSGRLVLYHSTTWEGLIFSFAVTNIQHILFYYVFVVSLPQWCGNFNEDKIFVFVLLCAWTTIDAQYIFIEWISECIIKQLLRTYWFYFLLKNLREEGIFLIRSLRNTYRGSWPHLQLSHGELISLSMENAIISRRLAILLENSMNFFVLRMKTNKASGERG